MASAASALYSAGIVLQALEARSAAREDALRFSLLRRLACQLRWLAGTALGLGGWGLQALALTLAPLTLVQPLLALGLLVLLAAGACVLRERVERRDIAAAILVATGLTGIALSAPERSSSHAPAALLATVLLGLAVLACAPYALRGRTHTPGLLVAAGAGVAYALDGLLTKLAADTAAASAWTGLAVWLPTMLVAAGVGTLSEMSALQTAPATRVAPVVAVVTTVVPVGLAPVVAGERWGTEASTQAALLTSLLVTFAGVLLLARSSAVIAVLSAEATKDETDTARRPRSSSAETKFLSTDSPSGEPSTVTRTTSPA